ncbi:Globin [Methylacidimicrobium sp. AP8]|uniref:globin domain-containing protein n=1 Tax=Methylacidimicrobium sp. AP8 TaxID=2730359 RepID=UPI0018BFC2D3|nr:globin domain-containing protein [Methylacidimicrobium sp. AP8]CAB4243364.1 Globin [Methylacidimicrobium sp. AP8]
MSINTALIQQSGAALQSLGTTVTEHFYDYMFTHYPEVRSLFPAEMTDQKLRLFQSLLFITGNVDKTEALLPYLRNLGVRHIRYDVRPEHYSVVGKCLLATLKHFLGPAWSGEMAESWIGAYNLAAGVCIEAASEAMKPDRYVPITLADVP